MLDTITAAFNRSPSDRRLVRPPQVSGVTPEQLLAWRAAAKRASLSLAAWIRAACDAAIAPAPREARHVLPPAATPRKARR